MKERWELARWQSYVQIMPHVKQGSITSPKDLVTFPWEQSRKEDIKQMIENAKKSENFDKMFPDKL